MRRQVGVVLAVLAAGSAAAAEPIAVPLVAAGSNAMPPHLRPAGAVDAAGGGWTVVEDGTAPGRRVLAQLGVWDGPGRVRLAVYQGPALARVRAGVRLNLVGGDTRRAGLALRLADAGTYYAAEADIRRGTVGLTRVEGGAATTLGEAVVPLETGRWYRIELGADGERLGVWLDGTEVVTAADRAGAAPGRVALLTRGDSVAVFDALDIRAIQ